MASKDKARTGLPFIHKTIEGLKGLYKKNPLLFVLACVVVGIAAVLLVAFGIFILISFVFLPVSGRSAGANQRVIFGYYDGKAIEYKQGNYLSQIVSSLNEQQKTQDTAQDASSYYFKAYSIWRQAFEATVVRFGILDESAKSGLTISNKRLDRETMKQSEYQEDGQFSLKRFKSTSDSQRSMTRQSLKENLLVQEFSNLLLSGGDSEKMTAYLKSVNSQERAFTFVSFPFSSFPDEEIKAFGQKNAKLFRSMKVSYIKASASKSLAQSLLKGISAGSQKFSEAISAAADKGYSGIEGIERSYWEIKDYFEDEKNAESVFGLAKDAYSPLMETKDGEWIFFFCQEAAVEPDFSRLDLSSKVWSYIQSREKGVIEAYCVKRADEFLSKAEKSYDAACKDFGVSPKQIKAFPINYGGFPLLNQADVEEYPELAGIQSNQDFLTAAFSLKKGELSKPQIVTDAVAVLRFDSENAPDENALSMIDYYYDYYLNQYLNEQVHSYFMKSPKLKDQFGGTFQKYVAPSN